MIPITTVQFGIEEEQRVLEVIRSGLIAQGPVVAEFEQRFAELCGTKHAIAVNNGTTALIAALQVLNLQPGDEVITSPFTFVATLNAIIEAGATAVFADIRDNDFNIDPTKVEALITERTRVIAPVHLYGQTADMNPLVEIANKHNLVLLEDTAQSHAARYHGKAAGSFGIGTFSFYATKNITTGEGGMITTNDDKIADSLRVLRNQGMRARYEYESVGNNYRLTDLQAALALPQLDRYSQTIKTRQENAAKLISGLRGVPGIKLPAQLPDREHVWHQFTVLITDETTITRDEFVVALREYGVGCGVYYPKVVFDYDSYRSHPLVRASAVPVATSVALQAVSLPVHAHLTDENIAEIVTTVRTVLGATS
ncbi:DegT/DnrJ/EryC1/StrS family aminotransferase [Lysinibacter sp. HNR]|uniref:DegT/DnrJ/EryC1/StrS family aminotransferase n=1 Tax=Lysinibacter sp. HNR TaxID=3031408 RepID=UPI002434D63B|nr:DegT/DnrJ/EryC1/StrS family aminotransferase [Lysinibacter sp. HNR]WGD38088.1 DegT/DnrJ/EryC1/StrS family aminotransferase [Lysinibacter sp. HNR]